MPELHQKATWNSARDLWETGQTVLLSEHSAAYSETLPPSGMTRNGVLFERPTSGHRTSGPACSFLPTPRASEGEKGGPNQKGSSGDLTLSSAAVRMLPTPRTSDTNGAGAHGTGGGLDLRTAVTLLPTPTASDGNGARNATANRSPGSTAHSGMTLNDVAHAELFGDYAPAIRRWEQVTGHPAPPPTEPTGRNGAHRLSARFAEWMMGLDPGWVTDIPISRTEQLRAIGNGVVPRQAVAALAEMKAVFDKEI